MRIHKFGRERFCYKGINSGQKNGQWKGDQVGYAAVHEWVKNRKIKPDLCERCKIRKVYDLANISEQYKRDVSDYEWLCRTCHMKKDGRLRNLRQDRKGEKNGNARLTEREVFEIRRFHQQGVKTGILSKRFRTSNCQVWKICNGKVWGHLLKRKEV